MASPLSIEGAKPQPHPHAHFSLIPHNDSPGAKKIIEHNYHLASIIPVPATPDNPAGVVYGINVGFYISNKSRYTLATIGRDGDIAVPVTGLNQESKMNKVSRIQCSFEVHKDTKAVLLYDRSSLATTYTIGETAIGNSFEQGRFPRRVVTSKQINDTFGFPGDVEFQIVWHNEEIDVEQQITCREDHPRFTRTVEDTPTVPPTRRVTRIHTPARGLLKIRYKTLRKLGQGTFGEVMRVVNIDSGAYMALKLIPWPQNGIRAPEYQYLKREVEVLAKLSHPNIVEFLGAQGLEEPEQYDGSRTEKRPCLEIFMGLKQGNIRQLMEAKAFEANQHLPRTFLHDGLKSLDYLESEHVLHRDVKPENFLFTTIGDRYLIQLTDFGLCNSVSNARSNLGSPLYMAPEVLLHNATQTPKIDVWSFFVTLAEVFNASRFRDKAITTHEEIIQAAEDAAEDSRFTELRPMAILNPDERASAGDMLDKLFQGEGRITTPQSQSAREKPSNIAPTQPQGGLAIAHKGPRRVSKPQLGVLGPLPAPMGKALRAGKRQPLPLAKLPAKDKQATDLWTWMSQDRKRVADIHRFS